MISEKALVNEAKTIEQIRKQFRKLLLTDLSVIILCIIFYGGRFDFWNDAFSYFGTTVTPAGYPNISSMLIFMSGLAASSIFCFKISRSFFPLQQVPHARLKHHLFKFTGIGYLIMMMPCNLYNTIHSIGSALVFGTLWLLAVLLLTEMKHPLKPFRYYLSQLLLQGTILPYAYTYVTKAVIDQVFQKFAVIGLILTLSFAVRFSCNYHSTTNKPDYHMVA